MPYLHITHKLTITGDHEGLLLLKRCSEPSDYVELTGVLENTSFETALLKWTLKCMALVYGLNYCEIDVSVLNYQITCNRLFCYIQLYMFICFLNL